MASLMFRDAEKARDAICAEDQKKIRRLYEDWANDIGERAKYYADKTTASSYWQEQQMLELQRQLTEQSKVIANQIYNGTKESLYTVSNSVVGSNAKFLADLGFPKDGLQAAFTDVPTQVVNNIVTGQIYEGGWNLSSAIWSDNEKTLSDIYSVVAKGRAQNMSAYEISKALESYVNPNKAKQWNLTMPDGARIYKKSVDYNAQRLTRTLTQHAYQQSVIQVAKANPFVQSIIWRANGSRACDLCLERDGKEYKWNEVPMDHPNGMCVMEPKINEEEMIDQLADWARSPDGTYPEIDTFATQFGYHATANAGNTYKRDLEAFDSLFTKHTYIYNSLSKEEQNAIKKYMSFEGVNENYKNKHLIDEAIKKAELTDNIVLRRGVKDLPTDISDAASLIGSEIRTSVKGKPISTTISSFTNFGTSTIEIKAERGTPGMFIDVARQSKQAEAARKKARASGVLTGESEFLLPSDTTIKIVGVRIDEKAKRIIYEAILK